MVLKVAYGYEVSTGSDDFIDRIENFFQETEKRLSRPYLVDFFPYCEHFLVCFLCCYLDFLDSSAISARMVPLRRLQANRSGT